MPIPSLTSRLRPPHSANKLANQQSTTEYIQPPTTTERPSTEPPDIKNPPILTAPAPSLTSQQDGNVGAKRRSFLPQRGVGLKTLVGKSGPAEKQTNRLHDDKESSRNSERALNMHETAHSNTISAHPQQGSQGQLVSNGPEQRDRGRNVVPSRSMRPPEIVNRQSESQNGLSRSQSLRKPGPIPQAASSSTVRAHSRTQSTNSVAGLPKSAGDTRMQLGRPRSVLPAPGHSTKSTTQAEGSMGATRTSARLESMKRSASVKTRPDTIQASEAVVNGTKSLASSAAIVPGRRRDIAKEEPKKLSRPAFSTLQQHFTPRKTGKAATSVFLNPPAPDVGNIALPAETAGLQAELLQLHLLHDSSAHVSRDWELSAKRTLHAKFDEIASLYHVMHENEREGQEQKNLRALREWNSGATSFGLVDHIQVLSGPLQELPSIVDPGGRFEHVLQEFSAWMARVEDIWSIRKKDASSLPGEFAFTGGLRDSWRAENAALTRKLTMFARDLDRLTQPVPDSSLAKIAGTCNDLLAGLLEELHMMQKMEEAVVNSEKEWVESRLQSMSVMDVVLDVAEGRESWRA